MIRKHEKVRQNCVDKIFSIGQGYFEEDVLLGPAV